MTNPYLSFNFIRLDTLFCRSTFRESVKLDDYYCGANLSVNHLRFEILLKRVQFYFFEQFADKGRPCSTRKQAYREYTATLLRIGAGGRRVGIQNEGVMRR